MVLSLEIFEGHAAPAAAVAALRVVGTHVPGMTASYKSCSTSPLAKECSWSIRESMEGLCSLGFMSNGIIARFLTLVFQPG